MNITLNDTERTAVWQTLRSNVADGAISHWGFASVFRHQPISIIELDEDNKPIDKHTLTPAAAGDAAQSILGGDHTIRSDISTQLYSELVANTPDDCAFDADVADAIVQIALFGELIYG